MLDEFLNRLALGRPVPEATEAFGDVSGMEREWRQAVVGNAYDPPGKK